MPDKQQTAMQQLIELMNELSIFSVRQEVKDKAKELLELEKHQLMHAYIVGGKQTIYLTGTLPVPKNEVIFDGSEDYYNQTYKS